MLWFTLITLLFTVISLVMILIILVQRPQGGGLAGAFGGAGGGGADTVFGGRVGDVLTWTTSIVFAVFLAVAVGLNWLDDFAAAPSGPPVITDAGGAEPTGDGVDAGAGTGGTSEGGAGDSGAGAGGETERP